jgi:hypothetical protein
VLVNFSYAQFVSISGHAYFTDNNAPVPRGTVYAYTLSAVLVQTAECLDGSYTLTNIPQNGEPLDVIILAEDELEDFMPTYYPDESVWQNATTVIPLTNLYNIDLYVDRIPGGGNYPIASSVSGSVDLNGAPVENAIVHAKVGDEIINYGRTNSKGQYVVDPLPLGDYILVVHRIGASTVMKNVNVTDKGLTGINFTLEKADLVKNNNTSNLKEYELSQNYPNPFNPVTKFNYVLPVNGNVKVSVFNSIGQVVKELVNGYQESGSYTVEFDGSALSSGIYYYKLEMGRFTETRKMVLVK